MKNTIRTISFVLIISLLFIAVTACNQPASTTTKPTATTAVTTAGTTTATTAAPEPFTLKFTGWGSPDEDKALDSACKAFENDHPWIKVNKLTIPNADYNAKLATMIAANEAPDAAYCNPAMALTLAREGKIENLTPYYENDDRVKDKLIPNSWFYWEPGKRTGISGGPETIQIFYNVDMFDAAGMPYPPSTIDTAWTWDQFVEVAKKMTIDVNGKNASEAGFDPANIKQFGFNMPTWYGIWSSFLYSNGADFVSQDGKTFTLDTPEAVEVIQNIADLMNVHHCMPTVAQGKAVPGTTQALMTKKVAMVLDGQWMLLDLGNAAKENELNFNIGIIPKYDKVVSQLLYGCTIVLASSQHKQDAWNLLIYLFDPQYSLALQAGGLWMPNFKDWYEKPELLEKWALNNPAHPSGYKTAVLDVLFDGVASPEATIDNFGKMLDLIYPALDQVWLGKKTAEDAMKELKPKVQPLCVGRLPTE